MPLWLQIAVGILTIAGGIIGFGVAIGYISYFMTRTQILEEMKKLEERIDKRIDKIKENIESNFKIFIQALKKEFSNPLSEEERKRKNELLYKLEIKTLTIEEAKELKNILQKELEEAQKQRDTATIIAIVAVLILLAFILSKE
ncbi:MAG: hypothetical protein ABIN15_06490 [candidate division WOR-3 bacterium]